MDFSPTQYQQAFLRGDKRYLGFISGVGAGKTYAGVIRTVLNLSRWNAGDMGAIVAPTRQMIVNVIVPEMRDLGLLDRWEYRSAYSDEPGIHTPEGSRALLLSADNNRTIERLRGLNLAWAWVDEATAVDPRAFQILKQRLRVGDYRNLFVTTTPNGYDHVHDLFVDHDDVQDSTFGDATVYERDDRLAIVGVPTDANPHLPEDYQQAMQQDLPEAVRAQEVQGRFVEVGGGVFARDMLTLTDPDTVADYVTPVVGIDPAVTADQQAANRQDSDYWAVCVGYVNQRHGYLYISDVGHRRGMSLQEGVDWINGIVAQLPTEATVAVESNQAQRWLAQELQQSGIHTTEAFSTRNKEDKLLDLAVPLSNDTIQFLDYGDGLADYDDLVTQLLAFPEGSHDDLLDALWLTMDTAPIETGIEPLTGGPERPSGVAGYE